MDWFAVGFAMLFLGFGLILAITVLVAGFDRYRGLPFTLICIGGSGLTLFIGAYSAAVLSDPQHEDNVTWSFKPLVRRRFNEGFFFVSAIAGALTILALLGAGVAWICSAIAAA
ncbi:hypothetical protein [Nocardia sp. BMG111209]|uniref:hypothetical protein n=1 Tax=Nocardia sp. BMG111209 TaxID=1160137 RepID=UPI00036F8CE2|nr:hypothetical protein [Nocardia sp. BMG111209]